jgi:hypothetical protein
MSAWGGPVKARSLWALAGAAAVLALLVLALGSADRGQHLADHHAAGYARHLAPGSVHSVTVQGPAVPVALRYERISQGPWMRSGKPLAQTELRELELALTLLRNAPPEREFAQAAPDFGLEQPSLTVTVQADQAAPLLLALGGSNPMGLSRYVQVQDGAKTTLALMPGDAVAPWERLLQMPR